MRTLVSAMIFFLSLAHAQHWTLEIASGASLKAPNTLVVRQRGFDATYVRNATYETRPLVPFTTIIGLTENYYSVRLGYEAVPPVGRVGVAYEVEFFHDKVYFVDGDDPGNVVQHFELTDGLNYLFFNVAHIVPLDGPTHLVGRLGGGLVITRPASVVRGMELGTRMHQGTEGFYAFAGFGGQASLQVRRYLSEAFALTTEVRYTAAITHNRISGGTASAVFQGVHLNLGVLLQLF